MGATLPLAMCRRYDDATDPDLILFRSAWADTAVADSLRIVAGFALGKTLDDLGTVAEAASTLRAANQLAQAEHPWSKRN